MTKIRSNIKENMKHSLFPILLFISIQFITFADEKKESYTNLSAQKTKELINDYKARSKKLTIIDVRTMDEYKKSHLANSRLIDFFDSNFEDKIKNLDKTIPYLVHCQSGGRSMKAFKLMQSLGFKRVYHLDGGMLAWKKLGKTIQE